MLVSKNNFTNFPSNTLNVKTKYSEVQRIRTHILNILDLDYYEKYSKEQIESLDKPVEYFTNTLKEIEKNKTLDFINKKKEIDNFLNFVETKGPGCLFVDCENLLYNFEENESIEKLGKALKREEIKDLIKTKNTTNENFKNCILFAQEHNKYRENDLKREFMSSGYENIHIIFTANQTEIDDILLIYAFKKNLEKNKCSTMISNDKFRWFSDWTIIPVSSNLEPQKKRLKYASLKIKSEIEETIKFYSKGLKIENNEILDDDISYVLRSYRTYKRKQRIGEGKVSKKRGKKLAKKTAKKLGKKTYKK